MKNSLLNNIFKNVIPQNYLSNLCGISLFLFVFISNPLHAQKEDYNWIFGEQDDSRLIFNFEDETLSIDTVETDMTFSGANASISDSLGDLQFYTNGLRLYDAHKHELMSNGDSLSAPSSYWDFANLFYNNSRMPQSNLILPSIQKKNTYDIFSIRVDTIITDNTGFLEQLAGTDLLRTTVHNENDSLWVSEKNVSVLNDTLMVSNLTACRHANGRDWWLVCQKGLSNCVNVLLYTPDTIYLHDRECNGVSNIQDDIGFSTFSPDGNKLVIASGRTGFKVFGFDRCSGQLNQIEYVSRNSFISPTVPNGIYLGQIAISSNSRYLYTGPSDSLYQFDLEASDILASKHLVFGKDTSSTTFYSMSYRHLGVDGKIYISAGSSLYYHAINNPDDANTTNIDVMLDLSKKGSASYGNFPNFRLGRLIGSPCDTLIDTTIAIRELSDLDVLEAYPNPAHTKIRIDYAGKFWERVSNLKLEVTDVLSRTYYNKSLPEYSAFQTLDIADYPKGVYFVYLKDEGKVLGTLKFVKR